MEISIHKMENVSIDTSLRFKASRDRGIGFPHNCSVHERFEERSVLTLVYHILQLAFICAVVTICDCDSCFDDVYAM